MTDATSSTKGTFVWRELMTPDAKKSVRFYGELFNWEIVPVDMGGLTYHLLHATRGGEDIGGIMPFEQPGMPAAWVSYVSVDDVDATAAAVAAAGGRILKPAMDIPKTGRFAVLADPHGAVFVGWRSSSGPKPLSHEPPKVGEFCWEALGAASVTDAAAFYGKVLGWTSKTDPNGNGTMFLAGEKMVGSVMPTPPGVPPHWMTHVAVENVADACARAKRLGGEVLMPDIKIAGYGTMSVIKDDVGAVISLFQPG